MLPCLLLSTSRTASVTFLHLPGSPREAGGSRKVEESD